MGKRKASWGHGGFHLRTISVFCFLTTALSACQGCYTSRQNWEEEETLGKSLLSNADGFLSSNEKSEAIGKVPHEVRFTKCQLIELMTYPTATVYGQLPEGLSFDTGSGLITGMVAPTVPSGPFTAGFKLDSEIYQVTIESGLLRFDHSDVSVGVLEAVNQIPSTDFCENDSSAITFSLDSGSILPAGWSLDAATGAIVGQSSTTVPPTPITVIATSSVTGATYSSTFSIEVVQRPPTCGSYPYVVPQLTFNDPVSIAGPGFTNGGFPTQTTFSLDAATLASLQLHGMSFNTQTGAITGTTTKVNLAGLVIQTSVTNPLGTVQCDPLTLTVLPDAPAGLTLVDSQSQVGPFNIRAGFPYQFNTQVNSGGLQCAFSVSTNGLPSGMSLNATTGVISGTPKQSGVFMPTVTCTTGVGSTFGVATLNVKAKLTLSFIEKNWGPSWNSRDASGPYTTQTYQSGYGWLVQSNYSTISPIDPNSVSYTLTEKASPSDIGTASTGQGFPDWTNSIPTTGLWFARSSTYLFSTKGFGTKVVVIELESTEFGKITEVELVGAAVKFGYDGAARPGYGFQNIKTIVNTHLDKARALLPNGFLDLSGFEKLESLTLNENVNVPALTLSNFRAQENPSLKNFTAFNNGLTAFPCEVDSTTGVCGVDPFEGSKNQLSQLVIANSAYVTSVNRKLSKIDLSSFPKLEIINISYQQLSGSLNLNGSLGLKEIYLQSNRLSSILIDQISSLTKVNFSNNLLTALPAATASVGSVESYWASNNQIAGALDFSNFLALKQLILGVNLVTSWSQPTTCQLEVLTLNANRLTSLNINNCPNLSSLNIADNGIVGSGIPAPILTNLPKLTALSAQSNKITSIVMTGSMTTPVIDLEPVNSSSSVFFKCGTLARIEWGYGPPCGTGYGRVYLNLSNNQLTKLNLTEVIAIQTLDVSKNSFASLLDIAFPAMPMASMHVLSLSNNPISGAIDLSTSMPALREFFLSSVIAANPVSVTLPSTLRTVEISNNTFNSTFTFSNPTFNFSGWNWGLATSESGMIFRMTNNQFTTPVTVDFTSSTATFYELNLTTLKLPAPSNTTPSLTIVPPNDNGFNTAMKLIYSGFNSEIPINWATAGVTPLPRLFWFESTSGTFTQFATSSPKLETLRFTGIPLNTLSVTGGAIPALSLHFGIASPQASALIENFFTGRTLVSFGKNGNLRIPLGTTLGVNTQAAKSMLTTPVVSGGYGWNYISP